ncbi:MAG: D-glycerate dehydrogenase, partial [Acidobacteriota bacterium]
EFVDLDGILSRSDIITLHVPLNEETTGLINARNVEKVKRGATLINTARGPVIEGLDFLHECLQQGIFGAIGLDVFPDEPPDTSHPLFRDPRCYLTGHVAARSPISQQRILDTMLKETLALLHGEMPNPSNIVNPEVLPRP